MAKVPCNGESPALRSRQTTVPQGTQHRALRGLGFCLWLLVAGFTPFVAAEDLRDADEPRATALPRGAVSEPPGWSFTVRRHVVYAAEADRRQRADVYRPQGDGPYPGVLLIHGGGWTSGSRIHMVTHARELARRGYVVMSIDYRLAPAHRHPAQLEDCRAALGWLRAHASEFGLDGDRIAAYGYSAGGHLACLLGVLPHPGLAPIQAVVAGGAPCDLRLVPPDADFLSYFLGGTRAEVPESYWRASPSAAVSSDDPPTFFFHGDADWLVPIEQAREMRRKLVQAGVAASFHTCVGKGHVGAFVDPEARAKSFDFLDALLQPPLPRKSEEPPDAGT